MNNKDSHVSPYTCLWCGSTHLDLAPEFTEFKRVTSDCKPWPSGGLLARCTNCQLVQTVTTPKWHAEAIEIYKNYTIYHQGAGAEQSAFVDGQAMARSDVIARFLTQRFQLPTKGRLLDIGCGNGAFLRACSRALPNWTLCGSEFDAKYKDIVEAIPNTEKLFTGDVQDIAGDFDLISIIHVLEHISAPLEVLQKVRSKLKPGGLLLVEVPDCLQNPYMLLIADHCSHFSAGVLSCGIAAAGFEVLYGDTGCVPKEITVISRKSDKGAPCSPHQFIEESDRIFSSSKLLTQVAQTAAPFAHRSDFGIFGSSIAATWLNAQLGGAAKFFVDEDPNRVGRTLMDKPIVSPQQAPDGAAIFVAMPAVTAQKISARLTQHGKHFEILGVW